MQNIKNFKPSLPFAVDAIKFGENVNSIGFLMSEDGQDWYECHSLFADDTVKIMYDETGCIHAVVDAPVPQRGNIYAVSMFNPVNMSVAEVAVAEYPENFVLDGTWFFDGITITQSAEIVEARMLQSNASAYKSRMRDATSELQSLQVVIDAGAASTNDEATYAGISDYIIELRRVDLTSSVIIWPTPPEGMI
jgi:hypothetical protein